MTYEVSLSCNSGSSGLKGLKEGKFTYQKDVGTTGDLS